MTVDSSTSLSPSTTSASTGTFAPGRMSSEVADRQLGRRHLDRLPVADDEGGRRSQVEQSPDGVVGAAAGAHLEPVPEQHEGRQQGRRLVEDLALDPEGGGDRVDPARADRHGDQDHHVEGAGAQRDPRPGKKIHDE